MNYHLSTYEIYTCAKGSMEELSEKEEIAVHLESCRYCEGRINQINNPQEIVIKRPIFKEVGIDGLQGAIIFPLQTIRTNSLLEESFPFIIWSAPYQSKVNQATVVDVLPIHDRPELAAQGDLFTAECDGIFDDSVISLWCKQAVPLSSLNLKKSVGRIGSETSEIIENWFSGNFEKCGRLSNYRLCGETDTANLFREQLQEYIKPWSCTPEVAEVVVTENEMSTVADKLESVYDFCVKFVEDTITEITNTASWVCDGLSTSPMVAQSFRGGDDGENEKSDVEFSKHFDRYNVSFDIEYSGEEEVDISIKVTDTRKSDAPSYSVNSIKLIDSKGREETRGLSSSKTLFHSVSFDSYIVAFYAENDCKFSVNFKLE